MNRYGIRGKLAGATLMALAACSTLEQLIPTREAPSINNQRASIAMESLKALTGIDAYIRLDNKPLRRHMENGLRAQAAATGVYTFRKMKVRFGQQLISIEATLDIAQAEGQSITADVQGDIILTFSGNQLIWLPRFEQISILESESGFEESAFSEASAELETELLARINRHITDALIVLGKNAIRMNPLPLGEIEVGATLRNFENVSASNTLELGGVFTVAGSTILIEPDLTSIALDLGFIPNISSCPADVRVSRSSFASEIKDREPVGINRLLGERKVLSHFFTEITGATRSTSVLHYWFADGVPVALEELPVEPSFRWRTWSSVEVDQSRARNWEVIVVEKRTGCILHSLAIQAQPMVNTAADPQVQSPETFSTFSLEFEKRVSGFSILEEQPAIALLQVTRSFLFEVLHDSLKHAQVTVDFDLANLPEQKLQGKLAPFSVDDILCEERECTRGRICESGLSQCTRRRDTRTCTTCLFRNPLNNRCVNEVADPICEAARTHQNAAYEAALVSCQERELVERMECEKLSAHELRSCEIEATAEQSVCTENRESVRKHRHATSFADVYVNRQVSGHLKAVFSDFSLDDDMSTIRLKLGFNADTRLAGSIRFDPRDSLGALGSCINSWQKRFTARLVVPQQTFGLIGAINAGRAELSTDWSGFQLDARILPGPLESMFVDNPNLLAECGIGLTINKVRNSLEGNVLETLAGNFKFEIQPQSSHIRLANASIVLDGQEYQATPQLMPGHLKYAISD